MFGWIDKSNIFRINKTKNKQCRFQQDNYMLFGWVDKNNILKISKQKTSIIDFNKTTQILYANKVRWKFNNP